MAESSKQCQVTVGRKDMSTAPFMVLSCDVDWRFSVLIIHLGLMNEENFLSELLMVQY